MVAHLVLYELAPDLPAGDRQRLHDALQHALASIPSIRSARIGRRMTLGVSYEQQMAEAYSYFALFEFDDADGLRAYLEHPAHADLGNSFWQCSRRTLVFDYELSGSDLTGSLHGWT